MLYVLRYLSVKLYGGFANPFMVKTRDHWGGTPGPSIGLVGPTPYTTTQSLSTIQDSLDQC